MCAVVAASTAKRRRINGNLGLSCKHLLASRRPRPKYMFRSPRQGRSARLVVPSVSSVILLLCLCSCQTIDPSDVTGSIGGKSAPSPPSHPAREGETYRARHPPTPKDPE